LVASQRQEVESHLRRAEILIGQQLWQQAGAELTAADVAAAGYEDLREQVQRVRARLRSFVTDDAARTCTEAAAALRQGNYAHARTVLRDARVPAQQQTVISHLRELSDLLEILDSGESFAEETLSQLYRHLEQSWNAALGSQMSGVLVEVAAIAATWDVPQMAPILVDLFRTPIISSFPIVVRNSLENSLGQMGQPGFDALVDRLAHTPPGDSSGRWVLDLLVGLNPARHANLLVKAYGRMQPSAQAQLVDWLCELSEQSCGVLLDLVAGTLRRLPSDFSLAKAVQSSIGDVRLENEAVKWASGGHHGAQIILEMMYHYPASAFKKR
jgi:hypothetical protein